MTRRDYINLINLDLREQCFMIGLIQAGGPVDDYAKGVLAGLINSLRAPADPFPHLPGVERPARG